MELMFNAQVIHLLTYPEVTANGVVHTGGEPDYRDVICKLITRIVVSVDTRRREALILKFDDDSMIAIPVSDEMHSALDFDFRTTGSHWWVR